MGVTETKRSKAGRIALIATVAALLLALLAWGVSGLQPRARAEAAAEPAGEIEPTPTPAAEPTPTPLAARGGYFTVEDGLFRPEAPLLRSEAAQALEQAAGLTVSSGESGEVLTEESLEALLEELFPAEAVAEAMETVKLRGDAAITRAEAAVCLNRLLGLAPAAEGGGFLDVPPEHWAAADIRAAAVDLSGVAPEEGFFFSAGKLYYISSEGYCLKNAFVGSLFFGPEGKYSSGSAELDDYVETILGEITAEGMTQEAMLRAAYEYVRDNFTYLRRNYYKIGDVGWQLEEALTMFSTGRGNCYCFASAFWALARGLGYDAKIVSGTCGRDAPHGWVEIYRDGVRYTYDVELEMVQLHQEDNTLADFYAMTDSRRAKQNYVEHSFSDDLVPRETNAGLQYR